MGASRSGDAERRWRSLIAAQERSGEGVAQFADRRGLCVATLYWWRSELRRRDRAATRIVPIEIVGPSRAPIGAVDAHFELELSCGRRLRVPPQFDAAELLRLIAAVERAC